MNQQERAVTPVIAIILMVAVLFVLAAAISVSFFGVAEDINDPAPNVADTTGEFEVGTDRDEQIVQITHLAGDNVDVENIEIVVRASMTFVDDRESRLVDLPANFRFMTENINGDNLIDSDVSVTDARIIHEEDSNVWKAGDTIQFGIRSSSGGGLIFVTVGAQKLTNLKYSSFIRSRTQFSQNTRSIRSGSATFAPYIQQPLPDIYQRVVDIRAILDL